MLIENLYKESDRVTARRLLFAGLVLAFIFGSGLLCSLNTIKKKPFVKHLPDSERLAAADQICTEIPKPEQFTFVEKYSLISSHAVGVTYRYRTDRNNEEISPIFFIWLTSHGWKQRSRLNFYKDKYTIVIENYDFSDHYIYTIKCAETAIDELSEVMP